MKKNKDISFRIPESGISLTGPLRTVQTQVRLTDAICDRCGSPGFKLEKVKLPTTPGVNSGMQSSLNKVAAPVQPIGKLKIQSNTRTTLQFCNCVNCVASRRQGD